MIKQLYSGAYWGHYNPRDFNELMEQIGARFVEQKHPDASMTSITYQIDVGNSKTVDIIFEDGCDVHPQRGLTGRVRVKLSGEERDLEKIGRIILKE